MSTLSKATFYAVDLKSSFQVQYNPKELKSGKAVPWAEHPAQGNTSRLEFQRLRPATLEMELLFDTTRDGDDVRDAWVNRLLALTDPITLPGSGEGLRMLKQRPTLVWFCWGELAFQGVVESIDATYLMFGPGGTPLRARAVVKLKEWAPEEHHSAGLRARGDGDLSSALVALQAGQTLSSLAAVYGTTAQRIGELNHIPDLLEVEAGTLLLVPTRDRAL